MSTSGETMAFDAIGTRWEIETATALDPGIRAAVLARIDAFDRAYSRFRTDSTVTAIARSEHGGKFTFPDDAGPLFDLYDLLHASTAGAVDPLVGADLEHLGYDATYSLRPRSDGARTPARASWSRDVHRDGVQVVTHGPVLIDVGAAGKGHLVDLVTDLLHAAGIDDALVDAGGDMRRTAPGALRVGLEHPGRPDQLVGVANLRQNALCASATNRRAWGHGLHHVLDPRTGRPTDDVVATWVVADDALTADGLSTALFFADPADLAPAGPFEFVRLQREGPLEYSAGFDGELFG